jgi:hypothetical protein
MVMIVKEHEKKAHGFISVTRIAADAHVSALPGVAGEGRICPGGVCAGPFWVVALEPGRRGD